MILLQDRKDPTGISYLSIKLLLIKKRQHYKPMSFFLFPCMINISASNAAIHPVPAAVTACLYTWSAASPPTKTPGIFVFEVIYIYNISSLI
jgi:hypothetical protein